MLKAALSTITHHEGVTHPGSGNVMLYFYIALCAGRDSLHVASIYGDGSVTNDNKLPSPRIQGQRY